MCFYQLPITMVTNQYNLLSYRFIVLFQKSKVLKSKYQQGCIPYGWCRVKPFSLVIQLLEATCLLISGSFLYFKTSSTVSSNCSFSFSLSPLPLSSRFPLLQLLSCFSLTSTFMITLGLIEKSKVMSPSQDSKTNHICRVLFPMYINIFTVPRHQDIDIFGRLVFTLNNSRKEVNS